MYVRMELTQTWLADWQLTFTYGCRLDSIYLKDKRLAKNETERKSGVIQ